MIYYFSKFLNGNVSFSLQDLCFHQILKYESHINYKTLNHTHTRTAAYTTHSPPVNIHSNGVPIVYFLMASLVVLYFLVFWGFLHPVEVKFICNIYYWHYRAWTTFIVNYFMYYEYYCNQLVSRWPCIFQVGIELRQIRLTSTKVNR